MEVFFRDTIGLPPRQAKVAGMVVPLIPRYRRLVPALHGRDHGDDLKAPGEVAAVIDEQAAGCGMTSGR